jgi:hypothetical protein
MSDLEDEPEFEETDDEFVVSLLFSLIEDPRHASDDELKSIRKWFSQLSFDPWDMPVPRNMQGITIEQEPLSGRDSSIRIHLAKRMFVEGQWSTSTTLHDYVSDLRRAVQHESARFAVYARRAGYILICVVPATAIVPEARRGAVLLEHLLVVCSINRGVILTGYTFSSLETTGIPEDARWLN